MVRGASSARKDKIPKVPKPKPKPKPEQKKKKVTNQQLLETAAELAKGLHEKSKGDPSDPNVHSSVRPGGKSGASHGAVDYKYEVNTDPLNVNLK